MRDCTPFWTGGFTRNATGDWQEAAPGAFQGCAQIVDKSRKRVRMIPHPWQLEFDDRLEEQRAAGLPMRAIVLKARKLGFSTWIALKMLQRLTQIPYQQAIVVAQDVKTAGQVFDMAKLAHAHLPTEDQLGLGFNIRPAIVAANFTPTGRKFMEFGEASRRLRMEGATGTSVFEIDTAGSGEAGRGLTPGQLHLSEVARWEGQQANRKMLSVLESVSYEQDTMVILESTANGLNHFYRRCMTALEGGKDPDSGEAYFMMFVPWWRDPGCARAFASPEQRERFIEGIGDTTRYEQVAQDEPMLVEVYGVTPEQLYWRRMKIREHPEKSVEQFDQENPHNIESAFIGSGRTVYGQILVTRAIKDAEAAPEPVCGSLNATGYTERRSRAGTVLVPSGAVWVPSERMRDKEPGLEVWEHPRGGRDAIEAELAPMPTAMSGPEALKAAEAAREGALVEEGSAAGAYVVFADIAEGEENTFSVGDFHAVQVFDHRTRKQVAVHESRMDIHELPLWLLLIALYYNRAWLAVEVNGPGIAVVDTLAKDYRYSRMFRRKRIETQREGEEEKPGWKTDQVTKPIMESALAAVLADGTHGLRHMRTARQLTTYIVTERGKHEAQRGEHDDLLVAAMGAHRIMDVVRPPSSGKRPRFMPSDPVTGY